MSLCVLGTMPDLPTLPFWQSEKTPHPEGFSGWGGAHSSGETFSHHSISAKNILDLMSICLDDAIPKVGKFFV